MKLVDDWIVPDGTAIPTIPKTISRLCQSDAVMIDIGSEMGYWAVTCGSFSKFVIAVEMNQYMFRALVGNTAIHDSHNVNCHTSLPSVIDEKISFVRIKRYLREFLSSDWLGAKVPLWIEAEVDEKTHKLLTNMGYSKYEFDNVQIYAPQSELDSIIITLQEPVADTALQGVRDLAQSLFTPPQPDNDDPIAVITRLQSMTDGWCSAEKTFKLFTTIMSDQLMNSIDLGTYGGQSLIPQAVAYKTLGRGIVHGIDAYSNYLCEDTTHTEENNFWWANINMNAIYRKMENVTSREDIQKHVKIHVKASNDVVESFADESVDLIYIDSNHHTDVVRRDILQWTPKIRRGGYIILNDVKWKGVETNLNLLEEYMVAWTCDSENCIAYKKS